MGYRFVIAAMIFLATFIVNMFKVDVSIIFIGMMELRSKNISFSHCGHLIPYTEPEYNTRPRLRTTSAQNSMFIISYFLGNLITTLPARYICDKLGPLWTIGGNILTASLMNGCIPFIIHLDYYTGLISRFVVGLCSGPVITACIILIDEWATAKEKHAFFAMLKGGSVALAATWPILGWNIKQNGWSWAFYEPSAITACWCLVWFFLVTDTPDAQTFIRDKEVLYIKSNIGNKTKKDVPYREILKSLPFWAFIVSQFGSGSVLYANLAALPFLLRLYEAYPIQKNGLMAGLPLFIRLIVGIVFAHIIHPLLKKQFSMISIFRAYIIISHFIPALLIIIMLSLECRNVVSLMVFVALYLGLNGANSAVGVHYPQVIAPNYANNIYIIGDVGVNAVTGFVSPVVTGLIFTYYTLRTVWSRILKVSVAMYVLSGLVFLILASVDKEQWDNQQEPKRRKSSLVNTAV